MSATVLRNAGLATVLTLTLGGIPGQEINIASSQDAQLIYPGETLALTLTASSPELFSRGVTIRLLDVRNELVSQYPLSAAQSSPDQIVDSLSGLAEGYYVYQVLPQSTSQRVNGSTPLAFTRIGVIPRPDPSITAENSPIAVDAWLAWRFPDDPRSIQRAARLMRRMGVWWVRDRLRWRDVEPSRGVWNWDRYRECYRLQADEGLRVVPVFHDVPEWASPGQSPEPAHRPDDLEDLTRFTRAVAENLGDVIAGVEIGNEFNSPIFWRGDSADFAAFLKAAAAGLWQGDPHLLRLLGSTTDALDLPPGRADAPGVLDNNVLAFVDAVSPHHYGPVHGVTEHLAWWREHAPEHPIWVTETGSTAIPRVGPFVSAEERAQADYLVQAYALALAGGAERVFYFCLCDFYEEGTRPFGLVECQGEHWIPRPGLVALARLAGQCSGGALMRQYPGDRSGAPLLAVAMGTPRGQIVAHWRDEGHGVISIGNDQRDLYGNVIEGQPDVGVSPVFMTGGPMRTPEVRRVSADRAPLPPLYIEIHHVVNPMGLEQGVHATAAGVTSADFSTSTHVSLRCGDGDETHAQILGDMAGHPPLFSRLRWPDFTGPLTVPLWHPNLPCRRLEQDLLTKSRGAVMDRAVHEEPFTPPVEVGRLGLLDPEEPHPAIRLPVRNTTGEKQFVELQWADESGPPRPLTVSALSLTIPPMSSTEAVFPADASLWPAGWEGNRSLATPFTWTAGEDRGVGVAAPEWGAIAHRADREVVIDGALEDWQGLWPWHLDATRTVVGPPPAVCDARLWAMWDDEALFLAATVRDDHIFNATPLTRPWGGDAIEIFLDLNAPESIGAGAYNSHVFQILCVPSLPDLPEGAFKIVQPSDASSEGAVHAVRSFEGDRGAVMVHEMRIPWTALGLTGPPVSREIGLEWAIDDVDGLSSPRSYMAWRGTVDDWRDTRGFSRLRLTPPPSSSRNSPLSSSRNSVAGPSS